MKNWKMIDALNYQYFAINGVVTYEDDNGDTHTMTLTSENLRHIMQRYADWFITDYEWTDHDSAYDSLYILWGAFMRINGERFGRMFRALDTEYNPLHNYDKDSIITIEHTGDIEHEKGTTQINTIAEMKVTTTAPETSVTNKVGAFDTSALTDASKTVNSGGTGSTTTDAHTDTYTNSGTDTDTFNNTDKTTERTRGNIGVTQSADMIANELRIRQRELTSIIVHEFMCENGYLSIDCDY